MTALHRVYLEPEGPIYTAIMTLVRNPNDMNTLFNPSSPIFDACLNVFCKNVEDIVQRITEFMVTTFIFVQTGFNYFFNIFYKSRRKEF